ncbi:MAG: type II toxin-antitoxin system ParD family antitoxin [Oceanicaulis sp.]|jgi:antitoxin ParD1/3/4|nr:type II toxin-antitoxin system ParD family antitoxin [Oceanicaulis sp.]MAZ90675.1 type II toxin-antitoxin system ParD family antitoxin [Maricaulis sp.]MBI75036.1 type II toxin-antitoxin system ParD family antitoxin [Oceanicaulis sp.]|tara:strand:- start:139 stop:375 length:237 start_codon:yes stop_codon:yes gene_type:complete
MPISLDKRWQIFVKEQVEQGRYKTEAEVIEDGLRLVEARLAELRDKLNASIERGGSHTIEDVEAHLDAVAERMKAEGF